MIERVVVSPLVRSEVSVHSVCLFAGLIEAYDVYTDVVAVPYFVFFSL